MTQEIEYQELCKEAKSTKEAWNRAIDNLITGYKQLHAAFAVGNEALLAQSKENLAKAQTALHKAEIVHKQAIDAFAEKIDEQCDALPLLIAFEKEERDRKQLAKKSKPLPEGRQN